MAVIDEGGRPVIIGGGRYIVEQPGKAEIAFAVVDEYQGQCIGGALMRHLAGIAREAGLKELTAEVLPDNNSMLESVLALTFASIGVHAAVWIGWRLLAQIGLSMTNLGVDRSNPKFWKRDRIFYCFSIACDEKRKSVLSTSLPQGTLRILRRLYLICAIAA